MFFEAKNIVVHYDTVMALRGVSINSDQGDIVTLIGSNGAGKSTTLRAISGLIDITSGEIYLDGQKISGLPPQKIVAMGVAQVPEGRRIFPYMRVGENLYMGAFLRKDKKQIKLDLEGIFGLFPILKERFKQLAGNLSGGEQQMLATARALMAKPRLLLLDEPSLGLSPMLTKAIASTILEINKENQVTIILVEQNARMALKLAKRGYVIETGAIALEDDSDKLANNDRVVRLYLGG
jgi:branched-chain amino acid transport system ATP-binding protein